MRGLLTTRRRSLLSALVQMSESMDINLPFISCSICHETTKNKALYLTSCAHILCTDHTNNLGGGSTIRRCMACDHENVTSIRLDDRVPQDIRPFLTPFPNQIEHFFAVAQFQYVGMTERIQHQEMMIQRLIQKMNKQKQLLLMAKEKVTQIEKLELRVKQLEHENSTLKATAIRSKSNNYYHEQKHRPSTIDLTMNDSFSSDFGRENVETSSSRDSIADTFVRQVKQNSTQKTAINRPYIPPFTSTAQIQKSYNNNQQSENSLDFAKSKIAESTNILHHSSSPIQANVPLGNKLHPIISRQESSDSNYSSSSGSKGGDRQFSNPSPVTSYSSSNHPHKNQDVPSFLPLHQQQAPSNAASRFSSNSNPRNSKQRASTAQIAQRLSAHMKIGSLQRTKSSQAASNEKGNSGRPVSTFSTNNRFRR